MTRISIIGTGYVGLVTGVSLAALGNTVVCVGRQQLKVNAINEGKSPFYEPGLDTLIKQLIQKKRLTATIDFNTAVMGSDITILAVGTPTVGNKIDLSAIKKATQQVANVLRNKKTYHVVVVKSTVVPGTTDEVVKPLLPSAVGLCMNPEFLREGNAVEDALHPDRIVIGQLDEKSGRVFSEIYKKNTCPKIFISLKTAELIKYTSNALFATLISFSNEIARISQKTGDIDVVDVWEAVHLDKRLTPVVNGKRVKPGFISYLYSGPGYGGSCFPKDTKALRAYAQSIGENPVIIDSVIKINDSQPFQTIALLRKELKSLRDKKIAILGFSFKPDTDDIRESPALTIISELVKLKAQVVVHDPVAKLPDRIIKQVTVANSVSNALNNADAVIVVTSWQEYKKLTPHEFKSKMKQAVVVDARRIYDKNAFIKAGISYNGIGYENEN